MVTVCGDFEKNTTYEIPKRLKLRRLLLRSGHSLVRTRECPAAVFDIPLKVLEVKLKIGRASWRESLWRAGVARSRTTIKDFQDVRTTSGARVESTPHEEHRRTW